MSIQYLPSGFGSNRPMVWEEMLFEEFRDGRILERNNFSNSESLCRSDTSHQVSAQSEKVQESMFFEEFRDGRCGGHVGHQNRTILAILDFYVAPIPPIKFQLNPTCGLGGDVVWKFSRSWISERNDFSTSESLCPSNASHQVSVQSKLRFVRRCPLENFKRATIAAILYSGTERFYQFWITMSLQCLPSSFSSIRLMVCEEKSLWRIPRWPPWRPSWISEQNDFSNSESLCPSDASHRVSAQSDYGLRGNVDWRILRWPPWRPYWISERNDLSNSESTSSHNSSHEVSAQSDLWFWRRCRKC